mmetsp:Transcript_9555/g.25068  ORF Transcript_9555/g.25068 Transcript_9555/m.25068 type:complete len:240 (+) Transcript_9555:326-1045(+)
MQSRSNGNVHEARRGSSKKRRALLRGEAAQHQFKLVEVDQQVITSFAGGFLAVVQVRANFEDPLQEMRLHVRYRQCASFNRTAAYSEPLFFFGRRSERAQMLENGSTVFNDFCVISEERDLACRINVVVPVWNGVEWDKAQLIRLSHFFQSENNLLRKRTIPSPNQVTSSFSFHIEIEGMQRRSRDRSSISNSGHLMHCLTDGQRLALSRQPKDTSSAMQGHKAARRCRVQKIDHIDKA